MFWSRGATRVRCDRQASQERRAVRQLRFEAQVACVLLMQRRVRDRQPLPSAGGELHALDVQMRLDHTDAVGAGLRAQLLERVDADIGK
jgi:hypothetical protein